MDVLPVVITDQLKFELNKDLLYQTPSGRLQPIITICWSRLIK